MTSKRFSVTGMSCSACSAAVERAVGRLEGVKSASVSLIANTLVCEYDEAVLTEAEIFSAVKKAGYSACPYSAEQKKSENENKGESISSRLFLSILFLILLMYISMGHMLGAPLPRLLDPKYNAVNFALIQLVLTLPVVYLNRKFYISGTKAFFNKAPNMDTLVAVGSAAALIYGIYSLGMIIYYVNLGNAELSHSYSMNLYFESAATILTLVTVGKFLEAKSRSRTEDAVKGLRRLSPDTAVIIENGVEREVRASEIKIGDLVSVKPGKMIPIDGTVVKGESSLDKKALTGESIPVEVGVGDEVLSASVNINGNLLIEAKKVGGETTLSKIIELVENAGASAAPIARLADKISGFFVPTVMLISLVTFAAWLALGKSFDFALTNGISVLVISCPCALGLATPVAITVCAGVCARKGILIKSASAIEALAAVDTAVLDKTGTVTKGKPSVTDILPINADKDELLRLAYSVEKLSEHPISAAVCEIAKTDDYYEAKEFKAIFGMGISAKINEKPLLCGNIKLMQKYGIDTELVSADYERLSKEGKTPLLFSFDNELRGIIAVADTLKENAKADILSLRRHNIEVYMLTGDNKLCADFIAKAAEIENVIADVLPDDKEKAIKKLRKERKGVLMVGDGINDSPAMVSASVGMAIGSGADIALDAADIILMNDKLSDVSRAVGFSKKTMKNIKENLFWAFFYNVLGIPIAAGLLYPSLGITLSPMIAAAAMSFSSVFVVLNALRLMRMK